MSIIRESSESAFVLRGTQDMMKSFAFAASFLLVLLKFIIRSLLEGGTIFTNIGISVTVILGAAAENNGNTNYLLLIMNARQ